MIDCTSLSFFDIIIKKVGGKMKSYKYIFMIVLFILPFICISSVRADYKATARNELGSSCDLYKGSTGYCFYQDKNLNSVAGAVRWLDTGDEVTVLTNYSQIPTKDKNLCSDYYVYVSFYYSNKANTYYGYYCNANLVSSDKLLTEELRQEFDAAGFPQSYWSKLAVLKDAHPSWSFKAINTGLDFSEAVSSETYGSRSLLRRSMSNDYAFLSLDNDSFDYVKDRYIPYDDTNGSNPWYKANYDTIAYYMDPRNYLSDMYIFQFETLSYNDTIADDNYKNSIDSIFGNDYLNKFTQNFLDAGKQSKVYI